MGHPLAGPTAEALRTAATGAGSGRSGQLRVLDPGQEVLERAALAVDENGLVLARFRVGLPAKGRRVLGKAAATLLEHVIGALHDALFFDAVDPDRLQRHVETVEDAVALRAALQGRGLIAFVADGARLPRISGIDDRPLDEPSVVPFESPGPLRVRLETPNAGTVAGMGVPEGVTLIVGGGYHGKSTLLRCVNRLIEPELLVEIEATAIVESSTDE